MLKNKIYKLKKTTKYTSCFDFTEGKFTDSILKNIEENSLIFILEIKEFVRKDSYGKELQRTAIKALLDGRVVFIVFICSHNILRTFFEEYFEEC